MNNSKLERLQIHSDAAIYDEDGKPIMMKDSIKYLGAMLHKTGRVDSEIGSKIGYTNQEFRTIMQIWNHTNIRKQRKLQLYQALILSKLLYGLQTIWLSKRLRQKINAFHCASVRKIIGIPHSYVSRVTNAEVLRLANMISLDRMLLRQQLVYYGRLYRNPKYPERQIMDTPVVNKRRGRPHLSWVEEIRKHVQRIGNEAEIIKNVKQWRKVVFEYCTTSVL